MSEHERGVADALASLRLRLPQSPEDARALRSQVRGVDEALARLLGSGEDEGGR